MSDRNNFGFGQLVNEGEFDGAHDHPEAAERDMAVDHQASQVVVGSSPDADVFGGILKGLGVTAAAAATAATVALGIAKDNSGRRIDLPGAGTVILSHTGDTPAGVRSGVTCKGNGASIISSVPAGQRIIVSLFIVYDELQSDQRSDAAGSPYYFVEAESFHFYLSIGAAFAHPPGAPPTRGSLSDGRVLLADLLMTNNGGTFEMVASGVLGTNEQWDGLGAQYQDNSGRRSDWIALEDSTNFPQFAAEDASLREESARDAIYQLAKMLQIQGTTPSGADLVGARTVTPAAGAYQAFDVARTLVAGQVNTQLKELLDYLRFCLFNGGQNVIQPAASKYGLRFDPTNLDSTRASLELYARTAGGGITVQRITGMQRGHIARAHEFFDDMFYPAQLPTTAAIGSPWTINGIGGYAHGPINARGGVYQLASGGGGTDYALMATAGGTAYKWWNIGAAPWAIAMFRFRLNDRSDVHFKLGLYSSVIHPEAADSAIELVFDHTADNNLRLFASSATGRGTGVVLGEITNNTWFTVRIAAAAANTAAGQFNNGNWVTATPGSGNFVSGGYNLAACVIETTTSSRTLDIDQAFAADGGLAADMS